VIVTKEFGRWHLSIAHTDRDPTWREISEARYRLIPNNVLTAMLLPPLEEYVNVHKHCFQMHEIDDPDSSEVSTHRQVQTTEQLA